MSDEMSVGVVIPIVSLTLIKATNFNKLRWSVTLVKPTEDVIILCYLSLKQLIMNVGVNLEVCKTICPSLIAMTSSFGQCTPTVCCLFLH